MESTLDDIANQAQGQVTEQQMDECQSMLKAAQQKAVDSAKAADRFVRGYPYQAMGIALGLGVLVGILVRRR